jgi:hypothetical protein
MTRRFTILLAALALSLASAANAFAATSNFEAAFVNIYSQCPIHPPTLVFCGDGTVAGFGRASSTASRSADADLRHRLRVDPRHPNDHAARWLRRADPGRDGDQVPTERIRGGERGGRAVYGREGLHGRWREWGLQRRERQWHGRQSFGR